jgi:hypothetical protein
MRVGFKCLLLAGILAIAVACTDSAGPGSGGGPRPLDSLNILHFAQGAPPLAEDSVSFYAVYGQEREGKIMLAGSTGDEEFLSFKVGDLSLLRDSSGHVFVPGDSVLITIKPVNPDSFYFEFRPAGLVFNPVSPAELELHYNYAGNQLVGDYNDDDKVDSLDSEIETQLDLWVQAKPGDPFARLKVLVEVSLDEIEAKIPHFSRFALAY